MKRKIVLLGKATHVVSLPSKWLKYHGLSKGDSVFVDSQDDDLLFRALEGSRQDEVFIDIKDFDERTIRNVLNQSYRKGYDKITLKCKNTSSIDIVKDITKHSLLGFDVVLEEGSKCVLENITEPSVDKYNTVLRKLFLTIKLEANEVISSIIERDFDEDKRLEVKNSVDNYTNFIRRLIIKHRIEGVKRSYFVYYALSLLSLIHHSYYYMHKAVMGKNVALSKEVKNLLLRTVEYYDLFYQGFYTQDLDKAHQVQSQKKELLSLTMSLLAKSSGDESIVLYHIGEIIRHIQMAGTTIFSFI